MDSSIKEYIINTELNWDNLHYGEDCAVKAVALHSYS
jgi:hypothetical protein